VIYTQVGNCCSVETVDNTTAATKLTPRQFGSETDLELAIEGAMQRMCAAPTRAGKLEHWREMCRLIDLRTPSRRRFMERTRGLA
jgi:hypothetical protein